MKYNTDKNKTALQWKDQIFISVPFTESSYFSLLGARVLWSIITAVPNKSCFPLSACLPSSLPHYFGFGHEHVLDIR